MPENTFPKCPICGADTDTYYYNKKLFEIIGCPECIDFWDAWETQPEERV